MSAGSTALLQRAVDGDTRAFTELLREHDAYLRALAFSLLQSQAAMEDALQDAYLKIYQNLRRFRNESSVRTWMYRIVYRTCISARQDAGEKSV